MLPGACSVPNDLETPLNGHLAARVAASPREAAIAFIRDVERLTEELRRADG